MQGGRMGTFCAEWSLEVNMRTAAGVLLHFMKHEATVS